MFIYNYDSDTKEYIGMLMAELDPEETKIQGIDVYLIPDNATTVKPPAPKEDKAIIWENGAWDYISDYRENYYKVSEDLSVFDIYTLGEIDEGYILVDKNLGDMIKENPDNYTIDNGNIREKTQQEKEQEEAERIAMLSLTKREVFLALYKDKGVTPEQIKAQISDPEALIEFEYASEYFRGNPLIDIIGNTLGYTKEQLDYLFEHKELPEAE